MKRPPDQIRLPLPIKQAIEDEAKLLSRSGNEGTVTQSEVVVRAWNCYLNRLGNGAVIGEISKAKEPKEITIPSQLPNKSSDTLYTSEGDLSPTERTWVQRFIRLIRAPNNAIRRAIKYNVLTFGLISEGILERPSPGISGTDLDLDAAIADLERTANEIEADQDEVGGGDEEPGTRRSGT